MKTINWITGGKVSENWAYGNNAISLINKFSGRYENEIDSKKDIFDVVVFFDILLMEKYMSRFPKAKKILRLGGIRPFINLLNKGKDHEKIVNKADAIVSVNSFLTENIFHKNVTVIPNSVNLNLFNSSGYVKPKEFTVGFVGNITNKDQQKWKGYDLLTEAMWDIKRPLKIATRGENEILNQNMKKEFYDKISCLILPSKSEGCSNSVGEALACGVPIILCNESPNYHTEKMTDGNNILFCERKIDSIYEGVRWLENPINWTRLHQNGEDFVKRNQNIEVVSTQWKDVIDILFWKKL